MIIDLESDLDCLLTQLGINSSTPYAKHASADILTRVKSAEIIPSSNLILRLPQGICVANQRDNYLFITPRGISERNNGDEVYLKFSGDDWIYSPTGQSDPLPALINFLVALLPDDPACVTLHQEKKLLRAKLLLSVLLAFFTDAKIPLVVFTGGHGTGKSTLALILLRLIYGPGASLQKTPDKEQDLLVHLSQERAVALDNLEEAPDYIHDVMCIAVTGGSHVGRKLYTNSEVVKSVLKNLIIVTAIDPSSIYRQDVLSRSLIFRCALPSKIVSESSLYAQVDANRQAFLSGLMELIVIHLSTPTTCVANHRLVEWQECASRVGVADNAVIELEKINQGNLLDSVPLVDIILLFRTMMQNNILPKTGMELHCQMQECFAAALQHASLKIMPSSWRKMAKIIRNHDKLFKDQCGLALETVGNNVSLKWGSLPA